MGIGYLESGVRQKGLVSVVMPAYNAAPFIGSAVESVLRQTYADLELVVVDDASKDKTASVLRGLHADARLRVLRHETNGGVARARNTALEASRGQYIAFLDADDLWEPDKLRKQIAAMQEAGVHASHASYFRFRTGDEGRAGVVRCRPRVARGDMIDGNLIGNLTGIYDSAALGVIFQRPIGHEDFLMWLAVLGHTDSVGVDTPLAWYREATGGVSSNYLRSAGWHYRLIRSEFGLSPPRAILHMVGYAWKALGKRAYLLASEGGSGSS